MYSKGRPLILIHSKEHSRSVLKGKALWASSQKDSEIWDAVFSHAGNEFCCACKDGSVIVYKTLFEEDNEEGVALKCAPLPICSVKESKEITQVLWSPNDVFILCIARENYYLLKKDKEGNYVIQMKISYSYDNCGAWLPDSETFIIGCSKGLSVVSLKKPLQTQSLLGHKFVTNLAVSWSDKDCSQRENNFAERKNVKILFSDSEGHIYLSFAPFHSFWLIAAFGSELSSLATPMDSTLIVIVGEEVQRWDISGITCSLLADRQRFRKSPGGKQLITGRKSLEDLRGNAQKNDNVLFSAPAGFGGKIFDASRKVLPDGQTFWGSFETPSFCPFYPLGSDDHASFSPEVVDFGVIGARLVGRYSGITMKRYRLKSCLSGNFVLAGSEDSRVYVWKESETPALALEGHSGPVNSVSSSCLSDRVILTASDDCTLRLWAIWNESV